MTSALFAASLLGLALFVLPAKQDPKTLTLTGKDGSMTSAQVVSVDGDLAQLRVFVLGGTMQVKRKLSDFTPASVFLIEREAKKPKDFDGHFAMAKRAAELGLVGHAGTEARAAVESAPADVQAAKKTEVRAWAAGALESMIRDNCEKKKVSEARHCLKILSTRLNDQRTEEQLDALAAEVDKVAQSAVAEKETERKKKLEEKTAAEIERRLEPIRKKVADGDKKQREAIRKSRSTVASTNLVEKAVDAYKAAWKDLQELTKKYPDDADLSQAAATLGQHMHDAAISAALHAANMLTMQSDYKSAMEWTTRILAFDPNNAEAKAMQHTIQVSAAAASSDWGWGWYMPTSPGGPPHVDPRDR